MTVHGAAKGNGLAPLTVTTLFGVSPSFPLGFVTFLFGQELGVFCQDGLAFHLVELRCGSHPPRPPTDALRPFSDQ